MVKKLVFIIALFLVNINVFALSYQGCDYASISKLKSIVNNVNLTTDYYEENGDIYYRLTLNNIVEEIYFVDEYTGKEYTYSNTNNGEITISGYDITSGKYKFYSNINSCRGTYLGTKYYKFPTYNIYYNDPICSDIPEYSLCQKWVNKLYSYQTFTQLVNEYKENLNKPITSDDQSTYKKDIFEIISEFYIKYYYYILGAIILICLTIIIIKERKDKFNL